jgi:hypothetical protein
MNRILEIFVCPGGGKGTGAEAAESLHVIRIRSVVRGHSRDNHNLKSSPRVGISRQKRREKTERKTKSSLLRRQLRKGRESRENRY